MKREKGILFLLTCALSCLPRVSAAECFAALDQTPGWKRVTLFSATPWLVAVGAQQQFRSDENVLLWSEGSVNYRGATRVLPGRTEFLFLVSERVRQLEVEFEKDLQDAKVDAEGWAGVRFPLQPQRRASGQVLQVAWTQSGLASVTLTVHHHLRHTPSVRHVRGGFYTVMTREEWLPQAFRSEHALYYLQPNGSSVQLCLLPGRTLEVESTTVRGTPQTIAIVSGTP